MQSALIFLKKFPENKYYSTTSNKKRLNPFTSLNFFSIIVTIIHNYLYILQYLQKESFFLMFIIDSRFKNEMN